MKVWILVFLFHGQPMASGPHELEVCLMMAESQPGSHCWNPAKPWDRQKPSASGKTP